MLGNYLQQTTSADDIIRCIFSWRFKGLKKSSFLEHVDLYPMVQRTMYASVMNSLFGKDVLPVADKVWFVLVGGGSCLFFNVLRG